MEKEHKDKQLLSHVTNKELESRLDLPIEQWDKIPEDLSIGEGFRETVLKNRKDES